MKKKPRLRNLSILILAIIANTAESTTTVNVLEYGGVELTDPSGEYEVHIINPDKVEPWSPTKITAKVTNLTITNEAPHHKAEFRSELRNSTIDGLLDFKTHSLGLGSSLLVTNSYVNKMKIGDQNTVEIGETSRVARIEAWENIAFSKVINKGIIESFSDLGIVENAGVATLTGNTGTVLNNARGTISVENDNGEPLSVIRLENTGMVTVSETTRMYITRLLRNSGTITSNSFYTVGVKPGTTTTNYGTISNYNTNEKSGGSAITITPDLPQARTVITNYGDIIADSIAISYMAKTGKGESLIIVENHGVIQGGIFTSKSEDGQPLHVRNGKYGHWSSMFGEILNGYRTLISKYDTIENMGTITNLKRADGLPGEIETGKFLNNGTIDIQQGPLVIVGNYKAGTGARLFTGGALGGDETQLPTLTIHGTVSGETTHVLVDNIGGTGAATTDGILVVRADTVDGEGFTKEGRIVAGAYDYDLVRVESGDHTEWRLTSALTPVPPGPEPGPEPVPPAPVHVVRPEAVTYAENLRQANTLFMTDSEQRRAVGEYTDPVTGRTETSSLWLSQTGGHSTRHDASGQLKSDYNRYTVQLGGTLLSLPAGDDGRLEAGVQAGYGHARGNTRSGLTGYRARGTVSGYSTGLYGTWRQHRDGQSGAYISTTLQYSWLNNQVKGDDLAAEKYDARGTTLSLEGGYDYAVWQGGVQNGDSLFIRPHAQVTRMGVKADEHREANGTRVRQQGDGSVFSRTGVRVWLDKAVSKGQRVQPFVETNWLHNTRDFCSSMDDVRDCLAGNRNQAEVLAGVRGDVSPDVAVTAQAGGRFGSQAGRDLAGTLNVSVKF